MKIGIIGAGFTGLTAGYNLAKQGHEVIIFEKDEKPGGLAIGYHEDGWDWSLEAHYHHWFTNDKSVLELAKAINHRVIVKRPKTSSFVNDTIYQLDSPSSLLKFPKLSLLERIRMGATLATLRFNPLWKPLENYKAEPYLKQMMGKKGYAMIWKPLMENKLGNYAHDVSLAWFWARIYKRTPSLAYPEGGFLAFAQHLEKEIQKLGGKFYYDTEVKNLTSHPKPKITFSPSRARSQTLTFDTVIVTLPTMLFFKIAPSLPQTYISKYSPLKNIGAVNLILRLNKPFFKDNTYWLNMCDKDSPILAVVEHTNFMNKKHYSNNHLLYLGNYMETTDKRFTMSEKELLKLYDPWLKKINPTYRKSLISSRLFRAPFAQPIIPPHYSKKIPPFTTPLQHVFLANIQQVYPWDRGTNYAVELGENVAGLVSHTK